MQTIYTYRISILIIKNGKVNFREINKQKYNLDDLLSQLREKVDSFNQEENELNLIKNQYKERVIEYRRHLHR